MTKGPKPRCLEELREPLSIGSVGPAFRLPGDSRCQDPPPIIVLTNIHQPMYVYIRSYIAATSAVFPLRMHTGGSEKPLAIMKRPLRDQAMFLKSCQGHLKHFSLLRDQHRLNRYWCPGLPARPHGLYSSCSDFVRHAMAGSRVATLYMYLHATNATATVSWKGTRRVQLGRQHGRHKIVCSIEGQSTNCTWLM